MKVYKLICDDLRAMGRQGGKPERLYEHLFSSLEKAQKHAQSDHEKRSVLIQYTTNAAIPKYLKWETRRAGKWMSTGTILYDYTVTEEEVH